MDDPLDGSHRYADSSYPYDHDRCSPSDSSVPLGHLDVPPLDDEFGQQPSSAALSGDFMKNAPFCENCAALAPWPCMVCSQMLVDIDSAVRPAADITCLDDNMIQPGRQTFSESLDFQDLEARNVSLGNKYHRMPHYSRLSLLNDMDRWLHNPLLVNGLDLPPNYGPGPVHRRRHFSIAEREEIAAKRGKVCDDCRRRKRRMS
jgi:hypothetical protein